METKKYHMKFFKGMDFIIILVILVVSGIFSGVYHFIFAEKPVKAEIYYYSELVKTVDLNLKEDRTFTIPQNENVVFHLYEDGSIAFVESDCPNKICIHAGKLKTVGQFAACLPNGIVVKIVPANERKEANYDIIIGQ